MSDFLSRGELQKLIIPFTAMVGILVVANFVVQYPFEPFGLAQWATWATLVYPITFLVNDLTNRFYGTQLTTKLIMTSFPAGIVIAAVIVDLRLAIASGVAFLISQQLDNKIFDRLRDRLWWQGPLISSCLASLIDTWIFYAAAFAGKTAQGVYFGGSYFEYEAPLWVGWALGDLVFKFMIAVALLLPYRLVQLAWLSRRSAVAP